MTAPYSPDVASLRSLLDDLSARNLLDRVQIVKLGDISVQLADPPPRLPVLTDQQEAAKEAARVEPLSIEELALAASEGGFT